VTSKRLPLVLASIHLALFLVALLSGGRYGNAFFCVDIPISLPMVLSYKTSTLVVVGLLGTVWWYFIGQIGRSSKEGKMSGLGCRFGAILILLICSIDFLAHVWESFFILRATESTILDVAVYFLAALLLSGGAVSGIAAKAAFRRAGQ
jgi:hypothetical protein